MNVRYGFEFRQLPVNLKGNTFQFVLGNTMTALELLLIERGMKGPGWLKIKKVRESRRQLTKGIPLEWEVEGPINVEVVS